jgi:hypothetical protein
MWTPSSPSASVCANSSPHLVFDRDVADDVVQQTYLAALEHPPAKLEPRSRFVASSVGAPERRSRSKASSRSARGPCSFRAGPPSHCRSAFSRTLLESSLMETLS